MRPAAHQFFGYQRDRIAFSGWKQLMRMIFSTSAAANRRLGEFIIKMRPRNRYGQMVNLLFVDYVQYARVTDVALFRNGERVTASEPRRVKKAR